MSNKTLSPEFILNNWPSIFDGHEHYSVGLSGGLDSVVLLHLLVSLKKIKSFNLSAIHVNHGISPNAKTWENFCKELCERWSIPLLIAGINVIKIGGQGLENSARKLRYEEFAKTKADIIVLGHHQDDLIETMFSQLLRGGGVHNMAGMRQTITRGSQVIWRPLLPLPKSALKDYIALNDLQHIEDESNLDNNYLRNFLRNKIFPELENFDNTVLTKLNKNIDNIQESVDLLDEIAYQDWKLCKVIGSSTPLPLELNNYKTLSELRQLNLLRYVIRKSQLPLPSQNQLKEFNRQILESRSDRTPNLELCSQKHLQRQKKLIIINAG